MHIYLDAQEARDVVERRRFTLAHEIGHWVCHCGEGRTSSRESIHCRPADPAASAEPLLEHEANNFAASLLMPEGAVRSAAKSGLDVPEAASHFMVSEIAMEWRFFNLGITDEPPAS